MIILVKSEHGEEDTKEIFTEALEIMKEKFPSPVIRILDLKIFEIQVYEGRTTFSIYCDKSEVVLTTSDDNSNSSDESVDTHNYDSMDESIENSDSFSESDENSESMDESDEDSENEDHINDQEIMIIGIMGQHLQRLIQILFNSKSKNSDSMDESCSINESW